MSYKMKESGVEWIGQIPDYWNTSILKKCLIEINDSNNPIKTKNVLSLTNKLGVVPYEDKGNQGNKAKEDYSGYKLAYEDTIVANSMNILIGSVGISKYYGCVSPVYYVFRTDKGADLRYINYIFQNVGFQKELRKYAKGIMEIRLRVSSHDILKRTIPLPDIKTQRQISDFLDKKCGHIDNVISATENSIEEYKKLKQSMITDAVTKGIRPNREMKDSGIEWIGMIPTDWKIERHKNVMHKMKDICESYDGENIISLTMNGVVIRDLDAGGKMPTSFDGYQYVEPDDLLLCLFDVDVTPRCVGLVKDHGITSPAYSRFKVHDGYLNRYYDYLLREIDDTKAFLHLAKNLRSSFTEDDFGAIHTIVPPYEEQVEIANYLDDKLPKIDSLISQKERFLSELEDYKKSIIYEYVTGKKEVPEL